MSKVTLNISKAAAAAWAKSWNVTQAATQEASAKAAQLGFGGDKGIVFLCAKGVDAASLHPHPKGSVNYHSLFDLISNPPDAEWKERREALRGIVGLPTTQNKRSRDEKLIPRKLSFNHFVAQHPQWAAGKTSFVFFRDHQDAHGKNMLIQREQIFGTCAIHAPVVMQHYLVALANKECMPTVAIPRWIRKHAPTSVLEGVVFGGGTNADQVLKYILLPKSIVHECLFEDIPWILRTCGPVLLPLWKVTDDFMDAKKWQYVGDPAPAAPVIGQHAMLVVGARHDSSGTVLLLQNWWRKKQFVEVGEKYYASCMGANAQYVLTPQPSIPSSFDTTNAVFSVSTVDGAGVAGVGAGPVR